MKIVWDQNFMKQQIGKQKVNLYECVDLDLFKLMVIQIQIFYLLKLAKMIFYIKLQVSTMNQNMFQKANKTIYHHIQGVVCLLGYGACGKGFVPLLKRHFTYDRFVIIDPFQVPQEGACDKFYHIGLTEVNYIQLLDQIFQKGKGFFVNFSISTSSRDLTEYCQQRGILYIDACKSQWLSWYLRQENTKTVRTLYRRRLALNEQILPKKHKTTAITCCGANPGMVNWFLKKALIDIAQETGYKIAQQPKTKQEWARLMKELGVKGVHVAQRDTQKTNLKRPMGHFWNTWSVEGLIYQGFQYYSQLGWGTHEKWFPPQAKQHQIGSKCGIYLTQPGLATEVRSWCPSPGAQLGYLITHDESISISDYYTLEQKGQVVFRPTVMYAYHPCDEAILSSFDLFASRQIPTKDKSKIFKQEEIVSGSDELGVLVYGHAKNAYWYGSQLSIERTRDLIPNQNSTVLQVTSSFIAAMVWAIENPEAGLVDTNQMDYKRCLQVQDQYIQELKGVFTDWNPLKGQQNSGQSFDETDPWQFRNILFRK